MIRLALAARRDTRRKTRCAREDMAGNQFEIQAGQLGQDRAQTQQVKDLAMHLAQDHQKAQQALQEACKGDASVSSNAELNAVQQAKLQELQKKQGEDFDRCFAFGMVADHEHDLYVYRWQADHALIRTCRSTLAIRSQCWKRT